MGNVDENMENMILMFMKYGTKNALTVDEFMTFRKQAVEECASGMAGGTHEPTPRRTESVIRTQEIHENAERHMHIPEKPFPATGTDSCRTPSKTTLPETDSDGECTDATFSETDFLRMMRCVDD